MSRLRLECPHCSRTLPAAFLRSAVGRLNNAKRVTMGARPKIRRPCPFCKKRRWGANELRVHKRTCPENPKSPNNVAGPFGILSHDD
jgi:hypothetical protein